MTLWHESAGQSCRHRPESRHGLSKRGHRRATAAGTATPSGADSGRHGDAQRSGQRPARRRPAERTAAGTATPSGADSSYVAFSKV
ncbi:hypothetical protein [Kibdelosporangium philippinense]|uniref:hypothetical protein n=1 Tax=Kibdelosporangium philippinense TaxID=211113 RepID=UPI0036214717